jgi:hypothetical protein
MTSIFLSLLRRPIAALALCSFVGAALASPGAHGPNGEHLDTMQAGSAAASTAPRLEAKSELFELVGRLSGGEFSILIDRFATNEPLLKADVEVESGQLKAKARFHEDLGDYAVDDPAMLKLLATPGEHPVVITVMAGEEADLLDGVLRVDAAQAPQAAQGHDHGHNGWRWGWGWGGLIALALAGAWAWLKRKQARAAIHNARGGQA